MPTARKNGRVKQSTLDPRIEAAGQALGAVHSIVMGLAVDAGKYFYLSDLTNATNLSHADVGFAVRDLMRHGLIKASGADKLFTLRTK